MDMKNIIKLLTFLSLASLAIAADQHSVGDEIQLKPLNEALDKGGLARLNSYLDEGGKWPRITTDSFATKNKITSQKKLVALSDRLVGLLRNRAETDASSEIEALESEVKLLFSLGEKLWKADGYRNRVLSLLCCDLASHRSGKIVIVSRGVKMGPKCPDVFKVSKSVDMLNLFVSMIPEHADLSESGLDKLLVHTPVKGETWLEMIAALRKIEFGGITIAEKFQDVVTLRADFIGNIISREDLSSLVFHYGSTQMLHESMLPALAMYLKNDGSLEILLKEPANATKFEEVMKNGVYQFSTTPLMSCNINGSSLALLVDSIQSSERLNQRLFGVKK
jgi:hypothetical protein